MKGLVLLFGLLIFVIITSVAFNSDKLALMTDCVNVMLVRFTLISIRFDKYASKN